MTDSSDRRIAIVAPPERPDYRSDASLDPDLIAMELRKSGKERDLKTFRTLINIKLGLKDPKSSAKWNLVKIELLRIISSSDDVGEEQVLLASLAFVNVLFRSCEFEDFSRQLRTYWNLEIPLLEAFGEVYHIRDLEWFKLALTHGYLQVNIETIYVRELISLPFEALRRNCLRYTKYSYSAYKTLQTWLEKTGKTDFWSQDDSASMEKDLEAIIFSNWDSCICEIARVNSSQIFSKYLQIMRKKYEGFLDYVYESCLENLSWQNVLKYTIMAEVCQIWDNLPKIVASDLPSCLFTSLTKNHLKHAGTKLYLTILSKLNTNEWERIFGESFFRISAIWEAEEQTSAIELLWEQWMKPTLAKFAGIFEYLWKHDSMKGLKLSQSYLERIGDRLGFQLFYEYHELRQILNDRVVDISEPVRLNAFAILCQMKNYKIADIDSFGAVKIFLYFNVNTSSVSMRKGILKYFDIFFDNILSFSAESKEANNLVADFLRWLHVFLLNCFEIGASYQRKILALSIYEIVLTMMNAGDSIVKLRSIHAPKKNKPDRLKICAMDLEESMDSDTNQIQKRKYRVYYDSSVIDKYLGISMEGWLYCNATSTVTMYTLVQDEIAEVREKATHLIIHYFATMSFSEDDNKNLRRKSLHYCSSPKSYDACIGAAFVRIVALWRSELHPPPVDDRNLIVSEHLENAREALSDMQRGSENIRLSTVAPVHGSLTALLEVAILIDPLCRDPDPEVAVNNTFYEDKIREILELAEDATRFFLSALSAKAKSAKYSSSFEEMARAMGDYTRGSEINVDEAEDCVLSTTHQLLLSCIWLSLKVSSEIAAGIGSIAESEEIARRSVDLIVSVLFKCRHKGAIEAAGLALAKLTKSLSTGKYSGLIESHLLDLLNIDENDNINLTRRGAGFSIMLHRIVSSDDRRNRPWLHMTIRKLLDSLKIETEDSPIQNEDCLVDSPRARHLHFLQTLVADKALQAQLVPYIEEICLICLKYLQSCEWTVRNASLQLFGAVVPRLVGQCSARELDYGVGNSVEHFSTHFPTLAGTIMRQLKASVDLFNRGESESSIIVPILTLLSKMSSGGCDLIDYSSKDYMSEARESFLKQFEHPVISVRALAGKAYAAFVPLPEIPLILTQLQLKSLLVKPSKQCNYQHGLFCAQLYLVRKLKHELQSTSDTFFIQKHKNCEDIARRANYLQLRLLASSINRWLRNEEQICYTVESALIKYLLESPIPFSREDFPLDWTQAHNAMSKKFEEASKPGFAEFLDDLMLLSARLDIRHETSNLSSLFRTGLDCPEHRVATLKNLRAERCNLQIFVDEAFAIIDDDAKSCSLLNVVSSISDAISSDCNSEEIPPELTLKIRELANRLEKINEKTTYARRLRNIGVRIALKVTSFDANLLDATMRYIFEEINDEEASVKESLIDCLSLLVNASRVDLVEFILKTSSVDGILFFKAIFELLTDEDSEIRESMARALQPITRCIDSHKKDAVCAKAALHMILKRLSLVWMYNCPKMDNYARSIFKSLAELSTIQAEVIRLEHEDLLNRDESAVINILLYFKTMLNKRKFPSDGYEMMQVQEINGIIQPTRTVKENMRGRQEPRLITDNTKRGTMEYLLSKKGFLYY